MSELPQDTPLQPAQVEEQTSPRRLGHMFAWGGLLVLLAILALGLDRSQKGPISVDQRAPNFTLTSFDGEEISLASLRGKVVVLNFWASWCKPCEQEAADLEAAWRYYQPSGQVMFIGVDYIDTKPEALAYLEKFDITYPNGPDLRTQISQSYRIAGVPETYFIDQEGMVTFKKVGPFTRYEDITQVIDSMLQP
jgi:cytochrome c biogenesis protein CcmG, thiol:disulfide interchange protein DsbE